MSNNLTDSLPDVNPKDLPELVDATPAEESACDEMLASLAERR